MADDGDKVLLQNEYGGFREATPEEASELVDTGGYAVATPEAAEQLALEREYGGVLGTAGSFAAGLVQEGTLGLGTAAISALGGAETLRNLEKVNPTAYTLGQATGILGSTVGTGGGALGLKAIAAPARLATRAGVAAERALGGGILGLAGGAAAESALFGVGSAVKELSLDDSPISGEKAAAALFHHVGSEALTGGLFGAGIGLAGKAALSVRGALGRMADAGVDAADRTVSTLAGKRPGHLKHLLKKDESGRFGFEVALDAAEEKARIADQTGEALARLFSDEQKLSYAVRGERKLAQIEKRIPVGMEAEQVLATHHALGTARTRLQSIVDDADAAFTKPARQEAKDLLRRVNAAERRFDDALRSGSKKAHVDAYKMMDDLRVHAWDSYSNVKGSKGRAARDSASALGDVWGGVREFLEDSSVWGSAADFQRGINASTSTLLEGKKHERFVKSFLTEVKGGGYEFNRGKWAAFMRNPNSDLASRVEMQQIARELMVKSDDYVQSVQRFADLTQEEADAIKRMARDRETVRSGIDRAKKVDDLQEQFYKLGGASDAATLMTGVGLGALVGNGPGAVVGGIASVIANPAVQLRRAAAVRKLIGSFEGSATGGMKRFLKNAGARSVAVAAASSGTAIPEKRDRFDRRRTELESSQANRESMRADLERAYAPIANQAPAVGAAMISKHIEAHDWLFNKLPIANKYITGKLPGAPPDVIPDAEVIRFERWDEAVNDPLSMFQKLGDGELTLDHVEALKGVWPAVYSEMQSQALEFVAGELGAGRVPHIEDRKRMTLLFDIPTDAYFEPELVMRLQAGYEAERQPLTRNDQPSAPPSKSRSGAALRDMSIAYATGSQKLEMK